MSFYKAWPMTSPTSTDWDTPRLSWSRRWLMVWIPSTRRTWPSKRSTGFKSTWCLMLPMTPWLCRLAWNYDFMYLTSRLPALIKVFMQFLWVYILEDIIGTVHEYSRTKNKISPGGRGCDRTLAIESRKNTRNSAFVKKIIYILFTLLRFTTSKIC